MTVKCGCRTFSPVSLPGRHLLFSVIAVAVFGCGHMPSSQYSPEEPVVFEPCQTPLNDLDATTRSYAAFLQVLRDFKWTIDSVEADQGKIGASVCLGHGDHSSECVTMTFLVDGEGRVVGYAEPEKPITREMAGHAVRWMRNADQRFSTYRCMIRPLAMQELALHGIQSAGR